MSTEQNKTILAIFLVLALSITVVVFTWYFIGTIQERIALDVAQYSGMSPMGVENIIESTLTRLNFLFLFVFFFLVLYTLAIIFVLFKENKLMRNQYEFLDMITHQLNTPLVSVQAGLWSLEKKNSSDGGELAEALKEKIQNAISLNNNLLFFLEKGLNNKAKESEECVIGIAVEEALLGLARQVEKKKIRVNFMHPSFDNSIKGDKRAMEYAIHAILENAVVYNKAEGTVEIKIDKKGAYINIEVKDSGFGIPTKEQSHIFDKFFRASNASMGKNEGSGISLYLARSIIGAHQGTLTCESKEGEGTTVEVSLPLEG
jgi:two-component system, OmpR family, phosphate regulon sensor histidine kinase PhoR